MDSERCDERFLALHKQNACSGTELAVEMKSVSPSARVEEHLLEVFRSQTPSLQTRPASRRRYWLVLRLPLS